MLLEHRAENQHLFGSPFRFWTTQELLAALSDAFHWCIDQIRGILLKLHDASIWDRFWEPLLEPRRIFLRRLIRVCVWRLVLCLPGPFRMGTKTIHSNDTSTEMSQSDRHPFHTQKFVFLLTLSRFGLPILEAYRSLSCPCLLLVGLLSSKSERNRAAIFGKVIREQQPRPARSLKLQTGETLRLIEWTSLRSLGTFPTRRR